MTSGIWLVQALDPAMAARLASAGLGEMITADGESAEEVRNDSSCASGGLVTPCASPVCDRASEGVQNVRAACDEMGKPETDDAPPEPDSLEDCGQTGTLRLASATPQQEERARAAYASGLDEPEWARYSAQAREGSMPWPVDGAACAFMPDSSVLKCATNMHRAPVVTAVSGRGGSGKSTLVAVMAAASASLGLRTAVLDLDLMFGNLHSLLGAEEVPDLAFLRGPSARGCYSEAELVHAGVRVGPGLTLWGPIAHPEEAELMGPSVELLLETLQRESDVVFVDTSTFWGDAVAAAVSKSSRCLVVGSQVTGAISSSSRTIELMTRLGVPRARMTAVLNRFGARGCDEEYAMHFELSCALGSKARISEGESDMASLLSFGKAAELVRADTPFARDVRSFTRESLLELGCSPGEWPESAAARGERRRLHLPWGKAVMAR